YDPELNLMQSQRHELVRTETAGWQETYPRIGGWATITSLRTYIAPIQPQCAGCYALQRRPCNTLRFSALLPGLQVSHIRPPSIRNTRALSMQGGGALAELNGERYLHFIALLLKDSHKRGRHVLNVLPI